MERQTLRQCALRGFHRHPGEEAADGASMGTPWHNAFEQHEPHAEQHKERLFVPMGFFLTRFFRLPSWVAVAVCCATSVCIECGLMDLQPHDMGMKESCPSSPWTVRQAPSSLGMTRCAVRKTTQTSLLIVGVEVTRQRGGGVGEHRVIHLADLLVRIMPGLVHPLGVARDGIDLATGLFELAIVVGQVLELRGADEREVGGVEEQTPKAMWWPTRSFLRMWGVTPTKSCAVSRPRSSSTNGSARSSSSVGQTNEKSAG